MGRASVVEGVGPSRRASENTARGSRLWTRAAASGKEANLRWEIPEQTPDQVGVRPAVPLSAGRAVRCGQTARFSSHPRLHPWKGLRANPPEAAWGAARFRGWFGAEGLVLCPGEMEEVGLVPA